MTDVVALAAELLTIDSSTGAESGAVDFVSKWLVARGWNVTLQEVTRGRANTLRTWLSMWSLETSQCQGPPQLAKLSVPALVVQSMADMGVFPSDARKIFDSIAAKDKTLELVKGAHYFEDSEKARTDAIDLMSAWISKH